MFRRVALFEKIMPAYYLNSLSSPSYPHRLTYDSVAEKFRPALGPKLAGLSDRKLVRALLKDTLKIPSEQYALGTTRLFLKTGMVGIVERLVDDGDGVDLADEVG